MVEYVCDVDRAYEVEIMGVRGLQKRDVQITQIRRFKFAEESIGEGMMSILEKEYT